MTSRPEYVVRQFTENECVITAIVRDPSDEQAVVYGIATRRGRLVGSYYCLDHVRDDWRIVTADGHQHESADPKSPLTEPMAVYALTNMAAPPAHRLLAPRFPSTPSPEDNSAWRGQRVPGTPERPRHSALILRLVTQ